MQEKLAITVLVITLALFALVLVLYNIVKNKGDEYNQIVLGHQDYESRTIPYKRGNIVDRNGTYLAISEKVYQQAAQAQGQQPGAQPGPDAGAQPKDDGAVDADFHEV